MTGNIADDFILQTQNSDTFAAELYKNIAIIELLYILMPDRFVVSQILICIDHENVKKSKFVLKNR